jgi:ribosomal protein L7Ae-like RNA K-turn-binding protein
MPPSTRGGAIYDNRNKRRNRTTAIADVIVSQLRGTLDETDIAAISSSLIQKQRAALNTSSRDSVLENEGVPQSEGKLSWAKIVTNRELSISEGDASIDSTSNISIPIVNSSFIEPITSPSEPERISHPPTRRQLISRAVNGDIDAVNQLAAMLHPSDFAIMRLLQLKLDKKLNELISQVNRQLSSVGVVVSTSPAVAAAAGSGRGKRLASTSFSSAYSLGLTPLIDSVLKPRGGLEHSPPSSIAAPAVPGAPLLSASGRQDLVREWVTASLERALMLYKDLVKHSASKASKVSTSHQGKLKSILQTVHGQAVVRFHPRSSSRLTAAAGQMSAGTPNGTLSSSSLKLRKGKAASGLLFQKKSSRISRLKARLVEQRIESWLNSHQEANEVYLKLKESRRSTTREVEEATSSAKKELLATAFAFLEAKRNEALKKLEQSGKIVLPFGKALSKNEFPGVSPQSIVYVRPLKPTKKQLHAVAKEMIASGKCRDPKVVSAEIRSKLSTPEVLSDTASDDVKLAVKLASINVRTSEAASLVKTLLPKPSAASSTPAYINQARLPELDDVVSELISTSLFFQVRASSSSSSSVVKRRVLVGLNEVSRAISAGTAKAVILATNLDQDNNVAGGLDAAVSSILHLAGTRSPPVPVVFALSRKLLGRALGKSIKVSVVALTSFEGLKGLHVKMFELAEKGRQMFEESNVLPPPTQQTAAEIPALARKPLNADAPEWKPSKQTVN